ncbi:hypothetical protein VY88_29305 [Azospirillum thiophilum]|nr:hypothetical protein VY88_29305 [Azospirillum thiophilum]
MDGLERIEVMAEEGTVVVGVVPVDETVSVLTTVVESVDITLVTLAPLIPPLMVSMAMDADFASFVAAGLLSCARIRCYSVS